jgi:NADPH:quinone reductase-like Zn-dependent oxidoreductase
VVAAARGAVPRHRDLLHAQALNEEITDMRAVRFDRYGGVDELYLADVPVPAAGPGEVVVAVKAAALNPGETPIREGRFDAMWPATFPSGQGTDFAGTVHEIGEGVADVAVGAEVVGWTERRASQAEYVGVPATQAVPKPVGVSWEVAGGLYVAGGAAWAGVTTVDPREGETVVVSGASGGAGIVTVQLTLERGARVIALASPVHREILEGFGATVVDYRPQDRLAERIRAAAPEGVAGWIDTFGGGYVDLAVELGVPPQRINTIADVDGAQRTGAQRIGTHDVTDAAVLAQLLDRVADGRIVLPIAKTYPLDKVQDAVRELEQRHTQGKIVLLP